MDQLTDTRRPQAETHRNFLQYGLAILHLGEHNLVIAHFLHSGIGQDINMITSETSLHELTRVDMAVRMGTKSTHLSILRKGFIVSVQDMSTTLDDVDRNLVSQDLGEGVEQVLVEQIKQLSCEFNPGWTTATNNERK